MPFIDATGPGPTAEAEQTRLGFARADPGAAALFIVEGDVLTGLTWFTHGGMLRSSWPPNSQLQEERSAREKNS